VYPVLSVGLFLHTQKSEIDLLIIIEDGIQHELLKLSILATYSHS